MVVPKKTATAVRELLQNDSSSNVIAAIARIIEDRARSTLKTPIERRRNGEAASHLRAACDILRSGTS